MRRDEGKGKIAFVDVAHPNYSPADHAGGRRRGASVHGARWQRENSHARPAAPHPPPLPRHHF